jgi:hypothetical protein
MSSRSGFVNEKAGGAPSLRVYLNLDSLADLRGESQWGGEQGVACYRQLLGDGFEGVQLTTDALPPTYTPLPYCGLDRINTPAEADAIVAKHALRGDACFTVHAGWGLEDDDESSRLVEAVLTASERYRLPVFIETHRATITQDIWRTVQITRRFPEVRFNGDFSHYYCGQELVYGNWDEKLAFMAPIFERIGFVHGRIASPGCMQVPIGRDINSRPQQAHGNIDYLVHFKDLWTRAMLGFLRNAVAGDVLIFAPELLPGTHYYARFFPNASGRMVEESDRYAQALLYKDLAHLCFARALSLSSAVDTQ